MIVVEQFGLDALQLGIDIPGLGTLTGGLVRRRIPQGERDSQARQYESAFAVDRKPDIDRGTAVLCTLFVDVKQNPKGTSHNT